MHGGRFIGFVAVFGLLAAFLIYYSYIDMAGGSTLSYPFDINVKSGMNASGIADMLFEKGIIKSPYYFRIVAKTGGFSDKFRAGRHIMKNQMKVKELAELLCMTPDKPPDVKVTFFEGVNLYEAASILKNTVKTDSTEFVKLATDSAYAAKLGIGNVSLEGYLYPDTYYINEQEKPSEIIGRLVHRFDEVFADSLKTRAAQLGMSVNQVITLASIIETEARHDEERPIISAVFHKRLKMKLPLQANPTVQYAIGEKKRLYKKDLEVDSPYNTYENAGLPPGPIANPGIKSILAALYPSDTKYLYFMADGEGGHVFSKSLEEHNIAVRKYLKNRNRIETDISRKGVQ